jgi:hypothetical protein
LALGPHGTTLYTAVQSPLAVPDAKSAMTSRTVRVLAVTTATGRPTAEYAYACSKRGLVDRLPPTTTAGHRRGGWTVITRSRR